MINQKYYEDIKKFPKQFQEGMSIANESTYRINQKKKNLYLCGLGGSSLFVDMINNFLQSLELNVRIIPIRGYTIPNYNLEDAFFFVVSHSGNTEEVISCYEQIISRNIEHMVIASGGKLQILAEKHSSPYIMVPSGIQPRLSTGYFISIILKVLIDSGLINDCSNDVISSASKIEGYLEENLTKELADRLVDKVPVIYATDNNFSIAHISKIKFNENVKTQAFWNFFPELNHNEMVGYTNMLMNPFFIIHKSKFTSERNYKRIEVFIKLMEEKGLGAWLVNLQGNNLLEEMLYAYYFIDHVTYYLAENYQIDPEPVELVEKFKDLIKE